MGSILLTIKKLLGNNENYTHFDVDIIVYINSVFSILNQLGVGPEEGFSISGDSEQWTDFLPEGLVLNMVKTYVEAKTKLFFDPPDRGPVIESLNKVIAELEWRLSIFNNSGEEEET